MNSPIPLGLYTHDPHWPNPRDFYRETSIGLANGEILIFYYGIGSNYPLYPFDGDEWIKISVKISAVKNSFMDDEYIYYDTLFMEHQTLVQILTIKNHDKDR